ncbi:NADH-cytochrome b5 reductase 1 [Dermacentor silvarum]|uniref:NADH-cytochrome b5 reductase 1 n=1 Tax=Dermacentor silvarum TaxID=543639 RepID=UPI00189BA2C5|nr:NADH-cytochrome b5 reductase 1 [Dermacentor silvarum]
MRLTVNRRPILVFLASAAAAFGAVALAVLLVRKIRVALAGEVLLTQERASYTVRLEQRIPVTHNVRLFRFALKSPQQRLGFRVGEHVLLYARIGDRTVMRPYTPVSRTDHRGSFDIMVKIYPAGVSRKHPNGGLMSQYLDSLQPGDKIEIQGPKGRFVYEGRGLFATADGRRLPLVTRLGLVAAGSGVTPMLTAAATPSRRRHRPDERHDDRRQPQRGRHHRAPGTRRVRQEPRGFQHTVCVEQAAYVRGRGGLLARTPEPGHHDRAPSAAGLWHDGAVLWAPTVHRRRLRAGPQGDRTQAAQSALLLNARLRPPLFLSSKLCGCILDR